MARGRCGRDAWRDAGMRLCACVPCAQPGNSALAWEVREAGQRPCMPAMKVDRIGAQGSRQVEGKELGTLPAGGRWATLTAGRHRRSRAEQRRRGCWYNRCCGWRRAPGKTRQAYAFGPGAFFMTSLPGEDGHAVLQVRLGLELKGDVRRCRRGSALGIAWLLVMGGGRAVAGQPVARYGVGHRLHLDGRLKPQTRPDVASDPCVNGRSGPAEAVVYCPFVPEHRMRQTGLDTQATGLGPQARASASSGGVMAAKVWRSAAAFSISSARVRVPSRQRRGREYP